MDLPFECLAIEPMASGHASLLLTRRVPWGSFPRYATGLLAILGGSAIDRADSPVERVWAVTVGGEAFRLSHDDLGVSLDARTAAASALLPSIRQRLEERRGAS